MVAHSKEKRCTRDTELNLEAVDALCGERRTWGADMDSEEMWTRKREAHMVDTGALHT